MATWVIPKLAAVYLPLLLSQLQAYWPEFSNPHYMAGQVEQETCITLTHSKCWSPRAELKTSRERGVGFGQITRTVRADGSVRFDALTEMKATHREALAKWSWSNPYDETMQMRALVLKNRDNWSAIKFAANADERSAMMLVAYNGGIGRVFNDRTLCRNTPGCDPSRWWGNIERTSLLQKTTINGYGKSFFDINREYPVMIMRKRSQKYIDYMKAITHANSDKAVR